MKPNILLSLALVLSGVLFGCSPIAHSARETSVNARHKGKLIEPWKDDTIKLVVLRSSGPMPTNGKSEELKVKEGLYEFNETSPSEIVAIDNNQWPILEVHDPYTHRICFIDDFDDSNNPFYVSDVTGLSAYWVGIGQLFWIGSYLEVPDSKGDAFAMAQFENILDSKMVNDKFLYSITNMIQFRDAFPRFYFSSGTGSTAGIQVEAIELTDGILRLDLRNSFTKVPAIVWIDLNSKKVTKAIVDGKEMDLSPAGIEARQNVPAIRAR